jgi:co-chaperonin GroES (HSP10)
MKYQPIRDVVAVQRDDREVYKGLLIIPDRARKLAWTGKVVAIGPSVEELEVGDRVWLPMHYSVDAWIDDKHILFYLEEEILMKEAKA